MLNTTTSQFLHSSASSNTKSEEVKTKSEAQVEIQVLSLSLSLILFMELIVMNIVLTSGFMSRLETKKMRANTEEEGFNSNQA